MPTKNEFCFRVSIETRDATGELLAVYIQIRKGKHAATKEYADGNVFADYDRSGHLLGFEMLAPCSVRILDKIAVDAPAKRFVRTAAPKGMLLGA